MKKLLIAMVVMAAATIVLAQGVSRPSVRSRRLATAHDASARIVRVLGLDNDYFRDTELFRSGQASTYSTEVVLNEPFGPFNKARCSLMTRTPSVVDVTTDDRSNATNALPRYFMERVTLTREYDRETTAEDLEGELKKVVDQLNGIFGCQLVSPVLSPVDDEDKKQEESKSKLHRQLRRPLMGAVFGVVPPLSVYIGLKGQQINIAAYEPVFCKRDGIVKLKMPAMMSMTIYMDQQLEMNHGLDDGDVEVKPVVLGADNVKAFSGAFSQTKGVNFGHSRSPAKYEYNRDTKRIVRGLDVDGSLAEDSLRRERLAVREEQRKQLETLRKVREERMKRVNDEKESPANAGSTTNNATNKLVQGKNVVAEKIQGCDFLLNKDFKKSAKFYLCLFSASWCPPCRREMPRIAQTYSEMLKDNPDIEIIHFSRDQDDRRALDWAKEHNVEFPVVAPDGGNPLNLHTRGIPHLFILKQDGTLLDEGHPASLFTEEKLRELGL